MTKGIGTATFPAIAVVVAVGATGLATADPAAADGLDALKAQVEALNAKIEAIEAERYVKPGNKNVQLSVSGQVNRLILYADDGDQGRLFSADNDESSTRVRVAGSAEMGEVTAGALIEVQFESNSTADITIDQPEAVGRNNFTERKFEVFFKHTEAGKLSLGQGDTASNGIAEIDRSGTVLTGASDNAALGESFAFVVSNSNGTPSGITVGDVLKNLDGLSRQDRIRYDTPSFHGVMASASWIDGGDWDVALRYGRNFEGYEVALGAAYWDSNSDSKVGHGGSGSILAPFGTNLTVSYTGESFDQAGRNDQHAFYGKLGQQLDLTSLGKTALAVDIMVTEDQNANGSEGMSYGFGAVQKIDRLATEAYLGARRFEVDTNQSTEPVDIIFSGARIKF